ncbi:MAG TPA: hypothetical protein VLA51_04555 [Paracoccaceae bacterium]|nr:hypothetical protein [Paracoccaceae bacterium]
MRFREQPLLNSPSMILAILREAAKGPATIDACIKHIQRLLAQTGETPKVTDSDIRSRLERLRGNLERALLISMVGPAAFSITARGREALRSHRMGFSTSDLMEYPEFATYIAGINKGYIPADLRANAFDEGYDAYFRGATPSDNPCGSDSADFMAWSNGWTEAMDEDRSFGT